MTNSIREALSEAMVETNEEDTSTERSAPVQVEASAPEKEPEAVAAVSPDTGAETTAPEGVVKSDTPTTAKEEPVKEESVAVKAPASWKAGAKERWGTLPPEVREEVMRRERDITTSLQAAAQKSQWADRFQQAVSPYQQVMLAEGTSDPIVAVTNLMQTVTTLRMGTPMQKAQTMARLIEHYGIDLPSLDALLAGNAQQALNAPTNQIEEILNQRLAPLNDFISRQQQQEQYVVNRTKQEALSAVQQFEQAGRAEFFEEVREDMADLMDLAARRGQSLTLEQAYEKAVAVHPEISKVMEQRKKAATQDLARKAAASSSVSGAPSPAGGGAPKDIRGALLAAMEQQRV